MLSQIKEIRHELTLDLKRNHYTPSHLTALEHSYLGENIFKSIKSATEAIFDDEYVTHYR